MTCQASKTVQVLNQPEQFADCVREQGHDGYHQAYIQGANGRTVSHRWFTRSRLAVRQQADGVAVGDRRG